MIRLTRADKPDYLAQREDDWTEALWTINTLRLNSRRLLKLRTDLLNYIGNLTEDLHNKIDDYQTADSERKSYRRKLELVDLVNELEDLMEPQQSHCFFCRQVIADDDDYVKAKAILTVP